MKVNDRYTPGLKEVVQRLKDARVQQVGTRPQFDAFAYQHVISVLESAVTFRPGISETDHRIVIANAVSAAAAKPAFDLPALLLHLEKAEIEHLKLPVQGYVLATSLAIRGFFSSAGQKRSAVINGARIAFSEKLPSNFDRSSIDHLVRRSVPRVPHGLVQVRVRVAARTPAAGYYTASRTLDLLRFFWNFSINRRILTRLEGAESLHPVNAILPGPLHTLHLCDGSLASEELWYDPLPMRDEWLYRMDRTWALRQKESVQFRRRLLRIRYAPDLEDAFVRYTRALDFADQDTAFSRLWAVLEYLVDSVGAYEQLIRRAAFLTSSSERELNLVVLQHLRDVRNSMVHENRSPSNMQTYLFQLKWFTEIVIDFHLRIGQRYPTLAKAARLLDVPHGPGALESRIRELKEALYDCQFAARMSLGPQIKTSNKKTEKIPTKANEKG